MPGITRWQRLNFPASGSGSMNLAKGVTDPDARARLTPRFGVFCKRILISNDYYPAMSASNVEVVTDPIARVTPDRHRDGRRRRAAGRRARRRHRLPRDRPAGRAPDPRARRPHARRDVADGRHDDVQGHDLHGFPNLFSVLGANTGQGHTSVILYIEALTDYVRDAIRTMRRERVRRGRADAPTPRRRWNADIQRRMRRTVWVRGGCTSWYLDDHGRNPILWPRLDRRVPARGRAVRRGRLRRTARRHEVLRRPGRRDHRRGLGHRAGAGGRPGRARGAAGPVRRRRRRASRRPSTW